MTVTRVKIVIDTPNALWVFDKRKLKKTMRQAGAEVSNLAKAMIRASGGQPGQAPKSQTGTLIRSIKIRPWKSGLGVFVIATALNAAGQPYGTFLEAGVQYQTSPVNRPSRVHRKRLAVLAAKVGSTTVLPRPFLSAALTQRQASLGARITASVDDGIAFVKQKP